MELTFTYKKNANHTEPSKVCSFKRSFGWTWMMRRLCSSSSLWLLIAWMHCFLKWWRQYIAGPNTGVRKVSRSGRAAISIDWTVVRYTSCLWLQVVTQLFEVTMGSSSYSVLWVQNLIIWNLVNLCVCQSGNTPHNLHANQDIATIAMGDVFCYRSSIPEFWSTSFNWGTVEAIEIGQAVDIQYIIWTLQGVLYVHSDSCFCSSSEVPGPVLIESFTGCPVWLWNA